MVTFSSKVFDIDGSVYVEVIGGDLVTRGSTRRVSRTKTLDGSVSLDDSGYAEGDRTFNFNVESISQSALETLHRIHSLYSVHRCATDEGMFEGVIESIGILNGTATITFLVSRKLSQ